MPKHKASVSDILEIDLDSLDEEWVNQPQLYYAYAKRLADARQKLDESKSEFELTKAELEKAIRDDPEKFDMPKVTEAAVKSCILTQDEYNNARTAVSEASHRVDVLQAVVIALEHRKRALEKLVDLHGQSYFAEPKASRSSRETVSDMKHHAAFKSAGKKRKRKETD